MRSIDAPEDYFEVDPELFWRLRPGLSVQGERTRFTTNALGLRGPELPGRPERGAVRILLVGDSVTFGYGVPSEGTFARQLERLQASSGGRPFEVVNGGVPGYTSWQGRALLERLWPAVDPDEVVISVGFNDARDASIPDREVARAGRDLPGSRVLGGSRLYRWLRARIAEPPHDASGASPVARVAPEDYARNLRSMVDSCRERGAGVTLLATPYQRGTLRPFGRGWFTLRHPVSLYRERARQVAEALQVHWVEVPELLESAHPGNARLFLDPAHPNEEGNRLIAEALHRRFSHDDGPSGRGPRPAAAVTRP